MQRDSAGRFQRGRDAGSNSRPAHSSISIVGTVGAILGAAAAGAAVMYLMDPNHGGDRRARALDLSGRALDAAGDATRGAYESASQLASGAHERLAQGLAMTHDALPDRKSLWQMARQISHGAYDAVSGASGAAGHMLSTARGWLPHRDPKPRARTRGILMPIALGATAFSTLVVGAAAMWVFDPDRGRARRAWLGQKANRAFNEVGNFARATGRHLRNKTKGYYFRGRNAVQSVGGPAREEEMQTLGSTDLRGV